MRLCYETVRQDLVLRSSKAILFSETWTVIHNIRGRTKLIIPHKLWQNHAIPIKSPHNPRKKIVDSSVGVHTADWSGSMLSVLHQSTYRSCAQEPLISPGAILPFADAHECPQIANTAIELARQAGVVVTE